MKKYVIIGASGFIGSTIKKRLIQISQAECIGLSSKECNLLDTAQVLNTLVPLMKDAVVVYAAGKHRMRSDSLETMFDNISMTNNFIEAARKAVPKKIIFLSSVEVYGNPRELPITEKTPVQPKTLYGIGKACSEMMLTRFYTNSLAIIRLPGVYGQGDTTGGFIYCLLKAIQGGTVFTLRGDGTDLRDYVFVEDVANAVFELSKEEASYCLINLATGNSLSLMQIINEAIKIFGDCVIKRETSLLPPQDLSFDITNLLNNLPHLKMTNLQHGLLKTKG